MFMLTMHRIVDWEELGCQRVLLFITGILHVRAMDFFVLKTLHSEIMLCHMIHMHHLDYARSNEIMHGAHLDRGAVSSPQPATTNSEVHTRTHTFELGEFEPSCVNP